MIKYLLEIGVEELPYKFIPSAIEQLKTGFSKFLEENQVGFSNIKVMATPRRLAVIISDLTDKQPDIEKIIKGPVKKAAFTEEGKLSPAGAGFLKKNNLSESDIYIENDYVHAKIKIEGKKTADLLKDNVSNIVLKLQGAHFMRWGYNDEKFSRPIRWIVSILDDKEIPVTIIDKTSSNVTRGHRFSKQNIVINHPDEYIDKLKDACVYVDQNERKSKIKELVKQEADKLNAKADYSDDLLEEVTYICEYPIAVVCEFDKDFLTIPQEVAVTVMEVHQRYFALYDNNGKLINKFITVTNYVGNEFENIRAGNLRVIKARLDDAVFFFREDTKKPLESYLENIKGITFQKGLGSMYDKTLRLVKLSSWIAKNLKIYNNETEIIQRTALLCKADLATNLVFEFTELQGFIGADYARVSGEDIKVADGIKEHYFPLNADSETASSIEGQIVGIADKIDTICAVFTGGKKPTGSSDPLGVRRAALGIVKTILEHNLNINIAELIQEAIELLPVKKEGALEEIVEFITQRLIIYLSDFYPKNILEACTSVNPLVDLCDYKNRVEALLSLNNPQLAENANRVIRILKENSRQEITPSLFNTTAEKDLYEAIKSVSIDNYANYIQYLNSLNPYVTKFFEDVLVMDKDEKIKNNRIALLTKLKNEYCRLADFSKV